VSRLLYLQAAKTQGLRRLACAAVHRRLTERYPGLRLRTRLVFSTVWVNVEVNPWWWLCLGLVHLLRGLQVSWHGNQELKQVRADVTLRVEVL
jgi:hypothetical protein